MHHGPANDVKSVNYSRRKKIAINSTHLSHHTNDPFHRLQFQIVFVTVQHLFQIIVPVKTRRNLIIIVMEARRESQF